MRTVRTILWYIGFPLRVLLFCVAWFICTLMSRDEDYVTDARKAFFPKKGE